MDRPYFSVVIPTRQRAETLRACLETCLAQDFDDYEVLVVDNASTPETRAVVEAAESDRVRYVRSDKLLAMSANWELAVGEARGQYVTVVGDDDALMPYALRELHRLIEEHDRPKAVRWNRAIWTWPTMAVPEDANFLALPMTRFVEWLDVREEIAGVIAFTASPERLPMIYSSVVRRDLLDELRERTGAVFPNIYPDIYSAFSVGWLAQTYLSVELPMSIAGLSGRSNGVATLILEPGSSAIADEFNSLNREFGYLPHPRVPDLTNGPVHIVDSFEYARDLLFPDEPSLDYDRWEMVQRYLATTTAVDEVERKKATEVIKATLDDRPDLRERVDEEAALHPPAAAFRFRPDRLGFDGGYLRIDTSGLGLEDVAACSRFVTRLLGVDSRPVEYGLPHPHRVHLEKLAYLERAEEAERRVAKAVTRARKLKQKLRAARAEAAPSKSRSPGSLPEPTRSEPTRSEAPLRRVRRRVATSLRSAKKAR